MLRMLGFTLLLLTSHLYAKELSHSTHLSADYPTGSRYQNVRLLGTLLLDSQKIEGYTIQSLSDLAWDNDAQILYAIADNGVLFHFKLQFDEKFSLPNQEGVAPVLTKATAIAAYPLRDEAGKPLKGKASDSEGLDILNGNNGVQGDSELIISFERIPRIARFSAMGEWKADIAVPAGLSDVKNYETPNKGMEGIVNHPYYGLVTAAERPLKNAAADQIQFLSVDKPLSWIAKVHPAENSSVVALESLNRTSLLVLERAFVALGQPFVISLRQIWLSSCECNQGQLSESKVLAEFNSVKGWAIDNFEGLAHHHDNFFFMVSDDNSSFLQRTLLQYFEVVDVTE